MSYFIFNHSLDDIFDEIRHKINRVQAENDRLREENKKIKSEKYAQKELAEMKTEYDEMREAYYRGFPISKEQMKAIQDWQRQHTENIHNAKTANQKMALEGVSGGRWSYIFTPTSIGTSGVCRCGSCYSKFREKWDKIKNDNLVSAYDIRDDLIKKYDAEFVFQDLD